VFRHRSRTPSFNPSDLPPTEKECSSPGVSPPRDSSAPASMMIKSPRDHLQQDWNGCSTAVAPNFSRYSLRQLPFDINVHRRVSQPRTRLHFVIVCIEGHVSCVPLSWPFPFECHLLELNPSTMTTADQLAPKPPSSSNYLSTAIHNPKFMDSWTFLHQPQALLTANESTLFP